MHVCVEYEGILPLPVMFGASSRKTLMADYVAYTGSKPPSTSMDYGEVYHGYHQINVQIYV